MSRLHQAVRRTIQRYALCPPGTRLLIGLSGGSDSVALALLLREFARLDGFEVVGLAHLNHRLRCTAARDEAFCRTLAEQLSLPIIVEAIDVESYSQNQGLSVEDAARRLRYDFLHRAVDSLKANRIAVGHTEDDQAETVLLKLIRGAGQTGLAGIYPRRGMVVRPLLEVSRTDLRDYLQARGQPWMDDETNADLANPRNRIRHRVLPELDRAYGGPVSPAIARAAAIVREDGQWLEELTERRFEALAVRGPDGIEIEASALTAEPPAIRRRLVLTAMRLAAPNREIGHQHVEMVLDIASRGAGGVDVPGARVELRHGKLVLLTNGR